MKPGTKTLLKSAALISLLAAAVWFGVRSMLDFQKSGEAGASTWFYDLSEKRLYQTGRDTIPPDKGIGGPSGDGVRALVVKFGNESDPANLRIAYLETHAAQLKTILDGVRTSRIALRKYAGRIPARDSAFYQDNTLVRREKDTDWHSLSSAEGRKILVEWRDWRGPAGERPVVSTPR